MEEIVRYKKQRSALKGALTRIYTFCMNPNAAYEDIRVRVERAEDVYKEFDMTQLQIESLTDETALRDEEKYRAEVEENFYTLKALLLRASSNHDAEQTVIENPDSQHSLSVAVQALVEHQSSMSALMERFTQSMQTGNTSTPNQDNAQQQYAQQQQSQHELRLPIVQIPDFDGNYMDWIRFRNLFDAMVHERTNISNTEKLEYLQTKLKGDALSIIKHLKPTSANYDVAWQMLKAKYDNTERLRKSYLELLFGHQQVKPTTADIKRFYNNINEGYNALKAIDEPVQHWDSILLFMLEKKLDNNTATLWFRAKSQNEPTTFKEFLSFLEKRIFEFENTHDSALHSANKKDHQSKNQTRAYTATVQSCPVCSKQHPLYLCEQFREMSVERRRSTVQENNICYNCLQSTHKAKDCKSSSCKKCNRKHNTLLHLPSLTGTQDKGESGRQSTIKQQQNHSVSHSVVEGCEEPSTSMSINVSQQNLRSYVILPTAIIMVYDQSGKLQPCRALLDSASQSTLITEACAQRLRLKRMYDKTELFGVGANNGKKTRGKVYLQFTNSIEEKTMVTEAFCLSNLTQRLPAHELSSQNLEFFRDLPLADSQYATPGTVDIILGAEVYSDIILPEKICHPSGAPTAFKTVFGWVIIGKGHTTQQNAIVSNHVSVDLDHQLRCFWEIEEVQSNVHKSTEEEQEAETHFVKNTQRNASGRFVVRLPLKSNIADIGESRSAALKRLLAVERKFKVDQNLKQEYSKFMQDYIKLGHMQEVDDTPQESVCFLPHHAVFKATSTSTKLRVVFDASCKTSNGRSLNDNLLVGPKIQNDLFDLLITFRKYEIAFVADIKKMYRQIMMHADDRALQRILWRESSDQVVKEYNLNTVTYGTSSAPFLATRVLYQAAVENAEKYPAASTAIKENFYVDDFMCCTPDVNQAIKLKDEVHAILSEAGFHLCKWASNSTEFLSTINHKDREVSSESVIEQASTVSTLGLHWNISGDFFKYSVSLSPISSTITKRIVLSDIARVFDPMGWIAPVVVRMKIYMQKLWLKGLDWNEQIPIELCNQWVDIRRNVEAVVGIKIPRWLKYTNEHEIELHGFADASEVAYAATVYMKVCSKNGDIHTQLVTAKTRIAPVKQLSLPRLELCAAHLLVKLIKRVRQILTVDSSAVYGWTDSTIVLAWLADHPRKWKSFIANRTAEIINEVPTQQWRHIASQHNPADLATRGTAAATLIDHGLWWHGPDEMKRSFEKPQKGIPIPMNSNMEERKQFIVNAVLAKESDIFHRYSTFTKLLRVVALLLRFLTNCRHKQKRVTGFLTTNELRDAHTTLVKMAQASTLAAELKIIKSGKQLPATHNLCSLAPFVDEQGVLRVGGRLSNANINYDQKHPIILTQRHQLTNLIVSDFHIKHCHAGKRLMHYVLHLKYWVHSATQVIKRCIYQCAVCMRQRAKPYQQQMGAVPKCRLEAGSAFINTGVDYAGPIQIRSWKGRGGKTHKCWIAIFICLVTKALHIELVTELSADAFIATLRRFVARRGKPTHIFSDNGTNFVGANHQLKELYNALSENKTQELVTKHLTEQEIQWHFSPPSGPHFGGIWEAGVKSIKYHLNRVLHQTSTTFEEMQTILCQIEGCLNSRPLCTKFEGDIDPLTPAHFLIMRPLTSVVDENYATIKENRMSRWQYLQRLVQDFWKKWSMEYLHQLQQRSKWKTTRINIKQHDVVLIKDENLPPSQWALGKVEELHPGADGLVRVVTLRTARGLLKRPTIKLCPLFQDV